MKKNRTLIGISALLVAMIIIVFALYVNNNNETSNSQTGREWMEALHSHALRVQQYAEIYQNPKEYPQALRYMLSRNPEMLDFVYAYPKKKGKLFSDTLGNVSKGVFPHLYQWDEKWGYAAYGDSILAISGCAPTTLSMVVAGLTGRSDVTPYTIAKYAETKGYYVHGVGSSWDLMEDMEQFGIASQSMENDRDSIFDALRKGYPIICSMLPGDFTSTGHFILFYGIQDGNIQVHDPNSIERSSKLWEYEALEHQIAALWCYQEMDF